MLFFTTARSQSADARAEAEDTGAVTVRRRRAPTRGPVPGRAAGASCCRRFHHSPPSTKTKAPGTLSTISTYPCKQSCSPACDAVPLAADAMPLTLYVAAARRPVPLTPLRGRARLCNVIACVAAMFGKVWGNNPIIKGSFVHMLPCAFSLCTGWVHAAPKSRVLERQVANNTARFCAQHI